MSAESAYNTSKADSETLVDSLLGGPDLNYVGHRSFVHKGSLAARHEKMHAELRELARQNELEGGQERNQLNRATINGARPSSLPHLFNGMELSWEEFQDNLRLQYGLMPQDIPMTCNGFGKRFWIEHTRSCLKGGLVLARHDDAVKYCGALGARALVSSAITYKP